MNKKARVLVITPWIGGFVDAQVSALRTRFDVTVGKVWPTDGPREWVATMNTLRGIRFDTYGYDFIHCYSAWPAGLYATTWGETGVPMVIHEHLSPPERLIQLSVARAFKCAAAVMCPSQSQADAVAAYTGRTPRVVANPVIVPAIRRQPREREAGKPLEVVCFGRYERQKGFDFVARAARFVDGVRLTFIGRGSQESELRTLAPEGTRFLPWVEGTTSTASLVSEFADIVCCPSRHESFGLACGEAVAMGIPVVATDVGAHRELVGDAGVVCAMSDASVSSAIQRVADDYASFSEAATKQADRVRTTFSPEKFVEQVEAVYAEAHHAHGGGMQVSK